MKKLRIILAAVVAVIFLTGSVLEAATQSRVRGHLKINGRYVHAHTKTKKNRSKADNWSHKGNVNPSTGKRGHK